MLHKKEHGLGSWNDVGSAADAMDINTDGMHLKWSMGCAYALSAICHGVTYVYGMFIWYCMDVY